MASSIEGGNPEGLVSGLGEDEGYVGEGGEEMYMMQGEEEMYMVDGEEVGTI